MSFYCKAHEYTTTVSDTECAFCASEKTDKNIEQLHTDLARVTAERDDLKRQLADTVRDSLLRGAKLAKQWKHLPSCPSARLPTLSGVCTCPWDEDGFERRAEAAEKELDEAMATISKLNRRAQSAESGLRHALDAPGERTLGRACANAAAKMWKDQHETVEAQCAAMREALEITATRLGQAPWVRGGSLALSEANRALSAYAGRAILDELTKLRAVRDAAEAGRCVEYPAELFSALEAAKK